ncbi:MAG: bifunctional 5,10-methylenetetrahydrofolate dehydrogenase/5,10-methenyltetrahydrofolate cyclohydrolase [Patescibacteria group bacterium]
MIFDGRAFARDRVEQLKLSTKQLATPLRVNFIFFEGNQAGEMFVKLKAKLAEEIGVKATTDCWPTNLSALEVKTKLSQMGGDPSVDGIVLQLPLPKGLTKRTQEILDTIPIAKDIDGLATGSCFQPAVVRAVMTVIDHFKLIKPETITAVVGAMGWVGQRMVQALKNEGLRVIEIDKDTESKLKDTKQADLIVSCTGQPSLITEDLVKTGAVVFDLGVMQVDQEGKKTGGDVDFERVASKAKFITPVPGGIGPVTVVSLFENLVEQKG